MNKVIFFIIFVCFLSVYIEKAPAGVGNIGGALASSAQAQAALAAANAAVEAAAAAASEALRNGTDEEAKEATKRLQAALAAREEAENTLKTSLAQGATSVAGINTSAVMPKSGTDDADTPAGAKMPATTLNGAPNAESAANAAEEAKKMAEAMNRIAAAKTLTELDAYLNSDNEQIRAAAQMKKIELARTTIATENNFSATTGTDSAQTENAETKKATTGDDKGKTSRTPGTTSNEDAAVTKTTETENTAAEYELVAQTQPDTAETKTNEAESIVVEYRILTKFQAEQAGLDWLDVVKKLAENAWAKQIDATKVLLTVDLDAAKNRIAAVFGDDFKKIFPLMQKSFDAPHADVAETQTHEAENTTAEYRILTKFQVEKTGLDWLDVVRKLAENAWAKQIDSTKVLLTVDLDAAKNRIAVVFGDDFKKIFFLMQESLDTHGKNKNNTGGQSK